MSYCRHCGAELQNDSAFCGRCGESTDATQPGVLEKQKKPGRGFGISSMVLGIIGLVVAIAMIMNAVNAQKETTAFADGGEQTYDEVLQMCLVYVVMPILSLCFASSAFGRGYRNGVSNSGQTMGILSLVGFGFAMFICFIAK